jgi:hypothetical protein
MNLKARTSLKIAYCLVVLSAVVPFGLAKSGWVTLATGGFGSVTFLGPLAFLALGLYRVFLVVRVPSALDSQATSGLETLIRALGKFMLYVGSLVAVLGWVSRPLMRAFIERRTDSGAEYFVVGMYLAMAGGIGVLGLILFEFSRLLAFERSARKALPL